jgi:hypothetical protein
MFVTEQSDAQSDGDLETPRSDSQGRVAAPNGSAKKFAALPGGVGSWMGALQITAGLALIGFIAKLAREQFLGIELSNWTALDLSIFAGRWAIDTLTTVLNQTLQHPFVFILPACLLLLPLVVSFALPVDHHLARLFALGSVAIAATGLLWVLVWCEMPTMAIENWLTKPLSIQLEEPTTRLMDRRESYLRLALFVSKMEGVAVPGGKVECPSSDTAASAASPGKGDNGSASAMPKAGRDRDGSISLGDAPKILTPFLQMPTHWHPLPPADAAGDDLNWLYSLSVVICLLGWLTLSLQNPAERTGTVDEIFRVLRLGIVLFLLPVVSCLLPYMYGKLLYSTKFLAARMTLKDQKMITPQEEVLVIDQTDKDISLLRTKPQLVPYILVIRREDVQSITLDVPQDVITQSIKNCNWMP